MVAPVIFISLHGAYQVHAVPCECSLKRPDGSINIYSIIFFVEYFFHKPLQVLAQWAGRCDIVPILPKAAFIVGASLHANAPEKRKKD